MQRGVTSANVDEQLKSPDPNVQRLLGVTGDLGKGMGLDNKWAKDLSGIQPLYLLGYLGGWCSSIHRGTRLGSC